MSLFISELQYIDELYHRLRQELARADSDDASLVGTVLRNEELMCRVGRLNERVSQLAEEWRVLKDRVEPALRRQVESLTLKIRADAEDLLRICTRDRGRLESNLDRLGRELQKLQKGFRHLDTVRPACTNYPKFIDSLG
jgi:hypothetical protein